MVNDSRGTLVISADDGAAAWTGAIKLTAVGKRGDEVIRRTVRNHVRVSNQVGCRPTREFVVSIKERSPYSLKLSPEKVTVEAGQKVEVKGILNRLWPEFMGSVNYQPLNVPGQFQFGNGTFQQGQTEVPISINVQPGTRPGEYTLVILGQAQVPFNKDPKAADKPNTLVSVPSVPVTIMVTEPQKK
jgi:hypothetical protein